MNILLLGKVGDAISDGFRSLMFILCDLVYSLIAFTFKVFQGLGTAEIISAKEINVLFGRISLIIGLFMIFRVTFSFIQYIVDPDAMLDKKKGAGNIIVKIVVAVVLLGSTSSLFRFAYDVQNKIIESNVISNIIFGTSQDVSNFGAQLSANVFTSFYRLNDAINTDDANDDVNKCIVLVTTDENGKNNLDEEIQSHDGKLNYTSARKCLNKRTGTNDEYIDTTGNKKEYVIDFDGGGFMALLVGIAVLYLIMVYSIQVGVRVLQLAYLQIVAPIPIAMYITPKGEEQLKKWGSQCLTTFLDFFLRTAIIYFAVYAIDMLWRSNLAENLIATTNMSNNIFGKSYITIIMIIAILVFAKKIPNLIKEIFPSLGGAAGFSYSMKLPDEAKKVGLFGAGAALGAAGAAASNVLYGAGSIRKNWKENEGTTGQKLWQATKGVFGTGASAIGGAASGLNKGRKIKDLKGVRGVVQQTNDNRDKRDLKQAAGYTVKDSIFDSIAGFAGLDTKAEGMIKEAQWQQQASEASRSAIWKEADDLVKTRDITPEYYSIARSIRQTIDANGKIQWKGLDRGGKEIIFDDASLETGLRDMSVGADDSIHAADLASAIRANADVDKRIKDEGKKIKGLEAAKNDAKK